MKNFTLTQVLSACHGTWLSGVTPKEPILSVVTDSRQVTPGCLFVAIPGEKVDGHDFVVSALKNGALCALVQKPVKDAEHLILVNNTIEALQDISAAYRNLFHIPVIGITGSVGKTTAKEIISSVLSEKYNVHKTQGNFNNDIGVPLTLLGLEQENDVAVVEMGVSHPGDMERLAKMVRPDMMLYTIIGDAHLEYLKSREGVLLEKTVANRYLPDSGIVFYNGDDPLLNGMCYKHRAVSFGQSDGNLVRAKYCNGEKKTCCIDCGERSFEVAVPGYGEHLLYAILEGAAIGIQLGLSNDEIVKGIEKYSPVGHRAKLIHTEKFTVIDDCYNANPTSVASAIRSLAEMNGRKVCILGDMRELGTNSKELHKDIGKLACELKIDLVITIGEEATEISLGAGKNTVHFESMQELLEEIPHLLKTGDVILIKASRSMHLETIVEKLECLD